MQPKVEMKEYKPTPVPQVKTLPKDQKKPTENKVTQGKGDNKLRQVKDLP
jgi:hypothetical protein